MASFSKFCLIFKKVYYFSVMDKSLKTENFERGSSFSHKWVLKL